MLGRKPKISFEEEWRARAHGRGARPLLLEPDGRGDSPRDPLGSALQALRYGRSGRRAERHALSRASAARRLDRRNLQRVHHTR